MIIISSMSLATMLCSSIFGRLCAGHVAICLSSCGQCLPCLQGQMALSEPAAGAGATQGMLIADPQTLSQLQVLVQQQQAVQGWHNASHLLQALHMQQQLQHSAGSSMGGPSHNLPEPQS